MDNSSHCCSNEAKDWSWFDVIRSNCGDGISCIGLGSALSSTAARTLSTIGGSFESKYRLISYILLSILTTNIDLSLCLSHTHSKISLLVKTPSSSTHQSTRSLSNQRLQTKVIKIRRLHRCPIHQQLFNPMFPNLPSPLILIPLSVSTR